MTQQTLDVLTIVVLVIDILLVGYISYKVIKRRQARLATEDTALVVPITVKDVNMPDNQISPNTIPEPLAPVLVSTGIDIDRSRKIEEKKRLIAALKREIAKRKAYLAQRDQQFIRYRKSFVARLVLQRELIDPYSELYNEILSYGGVKEKTSFKCSRFYNGRKTLVKIYARGKKLYVYLALDSTKQDSKYYLVNVSNKKIGENLPSLLKVFSMRSVRYAKELIAKIMGENKLEHQDIYLEDETIEDRFYSRSFRTLIGQREIIPYYTTRAINDFSFKKAKPKAEDTVILEKTADPVDIDITPYLGKSKNTGKLAIVNLSDLEDYFENEATITFADLKRLKLVPKSAKRVKFLARGGLEKTFYVEADEYSKEAIKFILLKKGTVKYRGQENLEVSEPKAKAESYVTQNDVSLDQNLDVQTSTNDAVILETESLENTIDDTTSIETEIPVANENNSLGLESEDHASCDNTVVLDESITTGPNAVAHLGKSKNTGKLAIVNLSDLEDYFANNSTITFSDLKRLKLISKSAKRVKLLARGGLEKTFHVEADEYSKEAIKLILLNNGTVKYRGQESEGNR